MTDSGYRRTSWVKTANLQLTHSYSLLQMFMIFVSSKRVSLSLYLYVCIIFSFIFVLGYTLESRITLVGVALSGTLGGSIQKS